MQGPKNKDPCGSYIKDRGHSFVYLNWDMGYEHFLLEQGFHLTQRSQSVRGWRGQSFSLSLSVFERVMMGKNTPGANCMKLISPLGLQNPSQRFGPVPFP